MNKYLKERLTALALGIGLFIGIIVSWLFFAFCFGFILEWFFEGIDFVRFYFRKYTAVFIPAIIWVGLVEWRLWKLKRR